MLRNTAIEISLALERILFAFLTLIEYLCFSYFLFQSIENTFVQKTIFVTSISFIVFSIVYTISAPYLPIDSIPIGIETIIILSFAFAFFYERMNDPKALFIYNDYRFWIVLAFMVYLAGSFFIYIFANQIPEAELPKYWMFTYAFYTIKNILFSIAMLILGLKKPQKKNTTTTNPLTPYLDM